MISPKRHDNCRKGLSVLLHQKKSKFYEGQGVNNAFGVGSCRSTEFHRNVNTFWRVVPLYSLGSRLIDFSYSTTQIQQFMKEKGGKRHFSSQKTNSEILVLPYKIIQLINRLKWKAKVLTVIDMKISRIFTWANFFIVRSKPTEPLCKDNRTGSGKVIISDLRSFWSAKKQSNSLQGKTNITPLNQ